MSALRTERMPGTRTETLNRALPVTIITLVNFGIFFHGLTSVRLWAKVMGSDACFAEVT